MIRAVLRHCRGWVCLQVQGAALERFVDFCRRSGIELWTVERIDLSCMTLCMAAGDWRWLEPRCGTTQCEVTVLGTHGLRMTLRPFKGRRTLIVSALLCLLPVFLSGQILWQVHIEGCSRIPQREIYDQLRGLGLAPGRLLEDIDPHFIRGRLMTARDDLSYVTILLEGTTARVTITEKDPARVAEVLPPPCDIHADRAGIVEAIQVRDGEAAVQAGDTVIPGDLLVSGRIVSTQGETRLVAADADITLHTWPSVEVALHPAQYVYAATGERSVRWSIQVGNRRFALPHIEKKNYACYYKTMETTAVSLGEGYFFPLALIRETRYVCTARRLELSEAACSQYLRTACTDRLAAQCMGGGFSEAAFTLDFRKDSIVARLQAECLQQTGKKTPITGEQ